MGGNDHIDTCFVIPVLGVASVAFVRVAFVDSLCLCGGDSSVFCGSISPNVTPFDSSRAANMFGVCCSFRHWNRWPRRSRICVTLHSVSHTIIIDVTVLHFAPVPIPGCSTDSDCASGSYCSSKKRCQQYHKDHCYYHSCGLGDGGSCMRS